MSCHLTCPGTRKNTTDNARVVGNPRTHGTKSSMQFARGCLPGRLWLSRKNPALRASWGWGERSSGQQPLHSSPASCSPYLLLEWQPSLLHPAPDPIPAYGSQPLYFKKKRARTQFFTWRELTSNKITWVQKYWDALILNPVNPKGEVHSKQRGKYREGGRIICLASPGPWNSRPVVSKIWSSR